MALIEIPLNSYRYNFRRLTWLEELRMKFPAGQDQRKIVLATAMVHVSDFPVKPAEAMKILKALPEAIFWRIWLLYRANLPADGYYTTTDLYEAPDTLTFQRGANPELQISNPEEDPASAEVRDISRRMFEHAKNEGKLTPVTPEGLRG